MGPKVVTNVNVNSSSSSSSSSSRKAPTKRGLTIPRAVKSQANKNTSRGAKVKILPKPTSKQPKLILQDPNLVKRLNTVNLNKSINTNILGAKVKILPKPTSKQPKLILQDPNLVKRLNTVNLIKSINSISQQLQSVVSKTSSEIRKAAVTKALSTSALKKNNRFSSLANISKALQTARAIATNANHPKQSDVSQLIVTYEKGWIDNKKFVELLRGMLF